MLQRRNILRATVLDLVVELLMELENFFTEIVLSASEKTLPESKREVGGLRPPISKSEQ